MNDIIRMAREAGWPSVALDNLPGTEDMHRLERFAALVRADERNRTWTQEHWTEYERSIAVAETEECAKVAEIAEPYQAADLIRARGQR
jgi:hypothetical protein